MSASFPLFSRALEQATFPAGLIPLLQRDTARRFQTPGLPKIRPLKTLHNPYSDVHIFQLDAQNLQRRLYVKVPHCGTQGMAVAHQRLQAEFDILQRLQGLKGLDDSTSAQRGYGTVEALNVYPEFPALATFETAPTTLREHYRSGARRLFSHTKREHLIPAVTHCGQWLRSFQEATDAGCGPFPAHELLAYIDIRLQRLVSTPGLHGLGFTEALAHDIRQRIRTVAQGIDPGKHRLCARHNDYASHNILTHQGRIWVIDFSMVDTGSSAFDPTTFWLDLDMLKADPSYSRAFISQLQTTFLEAYGGITPESPAFALVRTQYQLNRVLTLHTPLRLPTPGALYRRRVVRQCLSGLRGFVAG